MKDSATAPRRDLPCASWSLAVGERSMPIERPATVAAALRAAGEWSIDGPPRDFDDEAWAFRCRFDAPGDAAILGFDGLATCASVSLNGERILDSRSMFVRHRCDVASLLRATGNELVLEFAPLNAALRERRPRPRWRTPMLAQQQLRGWRTTLLGRTPGWSPPAAPVGVWRDVWLGPRESLVADAVHVHATLDGADGVVACRLDMRVDEQAEMRLARGGRTWVAPLTPDARGGALHGSLRIAGVERWWPHTHGEPAVYEASLVARTPHGAFEFALAPVGFRDIAIETADGRFSVSVNGVPVFCRGAVWTPLDPVSLRATEQDFARALAQVRSAGMNMLRVPGTGVYEEDAFYAACDRSGVLVWQDLMFANMDYPRGDEAFDALVEREVREQLQRLHAHPSIALVCGNSEAEQQAAMWGAPREAWSQPLFHEVLPRLVEQHAPQLAYWPSSAHGGALPQQPDAGSCSYYGVGAYLRPIEDARTSGLKFASECLAFANLPATDAAPPERTPRDLGAAWDFADVRDHYLERLYAVDARQLRSTDPQRYLALSRKVTGDVMAQAFAHWRRPGSGCGGALVLMARDLWAGAGWGLVDHEGNPKPCWHALRRALQPVAVFITDDGMNGLSAHVVNDSPRRRRLALHLRAWRDGEVQVAQGATSVELDAHASRTIALAALLDHFMDLNWSHRFGPPPCDVVACELRSEDGERFGDAFHVRPARFVAVQEAIGLKARARAVASDEWEVTVSTERFAWGVHVEADGVVVDDDWFDLAPGDERRVVIRGPQARLRGATVAALNANAAAPVVEEAA